MTCVSTDQAAERDETGRVPLTPEEVFDLLSHEIRLEIVCALYEAHQTRGSDRSTFSDLRDQVATRDSSQFNYHLKKLVGAFVREVDEGYELSETGRMVCQVLVAVADQLGIESQSLPEGLDCTYSERSTPSPTHIAE